MYDRSCIYTEFGIMNLRLNIKIKRLNSDKTYLNQLLPNNFICSGNFKEINFLTHIFAYFCSKCNF